MEKQAGNPHGPASDPSINIALELGITP